MDWRLQQLLGKQDQTGTLADDERAEAEGLFEVSGLLTLRRLKAERASLDAAQGGCASFPSGSATPSCRALATGASPVECPSSASRQPLTSTTSCRSLPANRPGSPNSLSPASRAGSEVVLARWPRTRTPSNRSRASFPPRPLVRPPNLERPLVRPDHGNRTGYHGAAERSPAHPSSPSARPRSGSGGTRRKGPRAPSCHFRAT